MRKTFRQLLNEQEHLILPCAHDAMSIRLIEEAGFQGCFIGGFGVAGSRFGVPDLGLASFGEIRDVVRDLVWSTGLPVLVDGDDGYGDVKNVTRAVQTYERLGAGGIVLEDQTNPKRCGHMARKEVVPVAEAEAKLRAAVAARQSRDDFFIVARTDARGVNGLDDALARGERFLSAGVDALFIEAPVSVEELRTIGKRFGERIPLLINAAEKSRTPILPPEEYVELGFRLICYPGTILLRVVKAIEDALEELKLGLRETPQGLPSFERLTEVFDIERWRQVEDLHREK